MFEGHRQAVDRRLEAFRVLQQRGDVIEKDPGLGKIWHVADLVLELVHDRLSLPCIVSLRDEELADLEAAIVSRQADVGDFNVLYVASRRTMPDVSFETLERFDVAFDRN